MAHLSTFYSLESYHRMGSRILSRSFHVERWQGKDEEGAQDEVEEPQNDSSMDVDNADAEETSDGTDVNQEENDEDGEDPSDVAMVPMADMLNARYGSENVRLPVFFSDKPKYMA